MNKNQGNASQRSTSNIYKNVIKYGIDSIIIIFYGFFGTVTARYL